MKTLNLSTHAHSEFVDITSRIKTLLREDEFEEGVCHVFVPHTTAGVTVNEAADPSVIQDILMESEKIVPLHDGYRHGEGNSAAHIKASLFGSSVMIPVSEGNLALGTWQGVYFCEFDGPRSRKVFVQFLRA